MRVGLFGVTVVVMTENVRTVVGVVVVAVLVVVGVVATSGGGDVDFTRNAAFLRMPKAQQARLIPAFAPQAAPKSLDTGPINKINKEVGPIFKGAKASIVSGTGVHALSTGKASVLEGKGVDGKGGTSSIRLGGGVNGKTGFIIVSNDGTDALSGRKASFRAGNGMNGVADRIEKCASGGTDLRVSDDGGSLTIKYNVVAAAYIGENCTKDSYSYNIEKGEAELLAECMDSKVGDVFLKSHIKASAADCVATVMPALSPKRAKQLGTYWQTQQQLICVPPKCGE